MKSLIYQISISMVLCLVVHPVFSQDDSVVIGDATITVICNDGKVATLDGSNCVYEVLFFNQDNLSLDQAKAKAAEFGWTLATAEELTAAFEKLNYSHFAYGTLADGRMAVPVQKDVSQFKKGTNIGVTGGNQGFFYTIKPGTPIVAPPPAAPVTTTAQPTTNDNTITIDSGPPIDQAEVAAAIDDYYKREFFKINGMPYTGSEVEKYNQLEAKYKNGIGNIMQDKWSDANYKPILEQALHAYVSTKFPNSYPSNKVHLVEYVKSQIQSKDESCADCMFTRYEYVGFFVPEYLKMLRTGSNPVLRQQFAEYVSYHMASASRKTLEAWKYYSRRESAQLNNEPYIPGLHLNNAPTLIDPSVLGSPSEYQYNTMSSIFIDTAVPLPGKSVDEFKANYMNGSPFYYTLEQNLVIMDFAIPLTAQSYPNEDGMGDMLSIPNYLSKNLSEEAKALNMAESIGIRAGTSVAIGSTALFGAFTLYAVQSATASATSAAQAAAAIATHSAQAAATALGAQTGSVVHVAVEPVVKIAITNSAKLGSKALGPLLQNAIGPVAAGVGVFMVGFMPTGGKAIEIAIFEDNLKKDCYLKDRNQDWMAMGDGEKIENFSFLFNMLVLDVKDFTYLVPPRKAGITEQRRIETAAAELLLQKKFLNISLRSQILSTMDDRYQLPSMHHYSEPGLTLDQAKSKAKFHGWTLASESDLVDAWEGGFEAYAYLRLADGRFAVPVQSDINQFKKGVNVGAEGGNQGFLYTVNKSDSKRIQNYWKKDLYIQSQESAVIQGAKSDSGGTDQWRIIPAGDGWIRIQSLKNPELYLNLSGSGNLEVVQIQPNWASALWKFHPTQAGYGKLQSKWYPDKFIHNENGKVELGYTQPTWWSAMWKFE